MSQTVILQPAFLIHQMPMAENDAVFTFFSRDYGRIRLWARGKLSFDAELLLFQQYLINWRGTSEQCSLTGLELVENHRIQVSSISSRNLYSCFYLSELLLFLPLNQASESLFTMMEWALASLQSEALADPILRIFERELLLESGVVASFDLDALTGQRLDSESRYNTISLSGNSYGFSKHSNGQFSGHSLIELGRNNLSDAAILSEIKHLMRPLIQNLIGHRKLTSRGLFRKLN